MKTTKSRIYLLVCLLASFALATLGACSLFDNDTQQVKLHKLELDTTDVRTEYTVGEELDTEGLVVTAVLSDETSFDVTDYTATANNLGEDGMLTAESDTVTVSYTQDDVTRTADYNITVKEKVTLVSIDVDTEDAKTAYTVGDALITDGLVVTAIYSDDTSARVSDYTATANNLDEDGNLTAASDTVTVTYTENGVDATAEYGITVSEAKSVFGTEDEPLSVTEALALAADLADGDVTEQVVYAVGIAKNTPAFTGSYYKELTILDEADPATSILIYTVNVNEGVDAPAENDKVVVCGYIKNYSGTIEFAAANGTYVYLLKNERGMSTITVNADGATVEGLVESALNGSVLPFTVTPDEGKRVASVKVNNATVEADAEGSYSLTVSGPMTVDVATEDESTVATEEIAALSFDSSVNGDDPSGGYNTTWVAERNGSYWDITNFNNNASLNRWDHVRAGSKSAASVATITTRSAMSEVITKVVVTIVNGQYNYNSNFASYINEFALLVSETEDFASATKITAQIAVGEIEFEIPADVQASNLYYRVVIDCKAGDGDNNGIIGLSKISYIGYMPEGVHQHVWSAWSHDEGAWTHSRTCSADGCDIVTETEACRPVLNVCADCDYEYKAEEIVAAVEALASGASLNGTYRLSGVVTEIDTAYDSYYKNVSFYMDITGVDYNLLAYRMGGDFAAEVAVGDTVTVYGSLINYKGTKEFSNGTIEDLVHPQLPDTYTVELGEHTGAVVDGLPQTVPAGTDVTFTVTASAGYEIVSVMANGTVVNANDDGSYTVTVNEDITITVETRSSSVTLYDITATFTPENRGYTHDESLDGITANAKDVSIAFDKNDAGTSPRSWNNNGKLEVRIYHKSTITVSVPEGYSIVKITLTYTASDGNTVSANVGELSNKVWTGEQREVVFTVSGKSNGKTGGHIKLTKLVIEYKSPVEECKHENLTKTDKVDAKCEAVGYEAYWTCETCGRMFSIDDPIDANEIFAPVVIEALGHNYKYEDLGDGNHSAECQRCDSVIESEAHDNLGENGACSKCGAAATTPDPDKPVGVYYQKITSADQLISGRKYLIVFENGEDEAYIFDGSDSSPDHSYNYKTATISDGKIQPVDDDDYSHYTFTITATEDNKYSIKSYSGIYIGNSGNSNGLKTSNTTIYNNTITFSAGQVKIAGEGNTTLQYNNGSNSTDHRFRYYKSQQKPVQLYMLVEA